MAVGESVIDSFIYTIADTTGLTATAVVTFNVTGLNDSPVAVDVNAGATTNENTTLNISAPGVLLGDTDPDTSDTPQAVSGSVTSANGASVSINTNGSYAFNPTGATALQSLTASGSIQDTFIYTVTDGHSGFDTAVVTVTVTGVNDAPVLDNSGNMLLSNIDEDNKTSNGDTVNAIVLSAGGDRINDVDDLRDGIAVIGVDNTNGTWQYSINDGANWIPFGSVSNFTAVLLDASGSDPTRIRFVPDTNYNGSAGNITFRAWDQTDGFSSGQTGVNVFTNGGSTPYSTATETATLTVNSVNDAPVLDNSGTMVLTDILEDASTILGDTVAAIISSAGGNRITDVDAGAVEGIAVIGIDNTNGNWQYKTQTGTSPLRQLCLLL
ncbi:MAG: Ig-like domain-containing protein [Anaerolineae bacterium]